MSLHSGKLKIPCLALCVLATAALLVSCSKKAGFAGMTMPAAPVRAVAAVARDVPVNLSAVGNVEAITTVDVKSRVAGQVLRVDFEAGQNVEKGQLLFEIDPEPINRQLAEYRADLARDSALEQESRANVSKDQALLKQTKASADRAVELAKEGIYAKEQTEQVVETAESAQATLQADKAAVDSAVASIKADRAKVAQTQLQLDYTRIAAPISGRAGAIAIKAGNLIKDNDAALVTLLQIAPIYVSFGLPEQQLPEVRKYNAEHPLAVNATANSENTVTGTLCFIDNSVDSTTGTIRLKAEFKNADRALWPGQFVNVQAQLNMEHNRVVIPSRTVETGPQGKYVWVMNPADQTVAMRPVDVLRNYTPKKSAEEAVIGSGLHPGEMVISEGQMRLAPGMKVQLLENQAELGKAGARQPAGQS